MFGWQWFSGGERRGKSECPASFALFIFFYTLNLNIIFLSVYLNFLWIKREQEDVKNWNHLPIRETGALAMLPNHHGNCFLYNLTIWCQSNRQRTCYRKFYFKVRQPELFPVWKLNWTVCDSVQFILFFVVVVFESEASHCGLLEGGLQQPYNHIQSYKLWSASYCEKTQQIQDSEMSVRVFFKFVSHVQILSLQAQKTHSDPLEPFRHPL